MSEVKHRAMLRISYPVLCDMLALPENAEIISIVYDSSDIGREQITLIIEHPDLPEWEALMELVPVVAEYQEQFIGDHELKAKFTRWVR